MDLIFGGAYQGKLEYVKAHMNIKEGEIFFCEQGMENIEMDFTQKAIYGLENFTLSCVKKGIEAKEYLEANSEKLKGKCIICTDISQGVVPMDQEMRAWREMNGRTMIYLGGRAHTVTRIFCGLPQKIK